MLLNHNNNILNTQHDGIKTLDDILDKTTPNVEKYKGWSKLTKMEKIIKINNYVDSISSEQNLNSKDIEELKQYLRQCLNRKMLLRIKDVIYDKKDGVIKKITGLHFKTGVLNPKEKKYTLRQTDKKDSTLKNLGSGKSNKKKFLHKAKKTSNISPTQNVE